MHDIVRHDHANDLLALSGACLEKRESENNLPLGLAYTLARDPRYYGDEPPLLLSLVKGGSPVGVAVRTPPRRIVLSRFDTDIEAAVDRLVGFLCDGETRIPGVVGPERESRCFADGWKKTHSGLAVEQSTRLRVFEARGVVDVPLAPGGLRPAEMVDHSLMTKWIAAFSREAIGEAVDPSKAERNAEKYIEEGNLYIWDHDGPVSIARESRAMKKGTVISTVYTPQAFRKRGYATSCVYHLTKKLLAGPYEFCSLFTDLSNPTTNRIYPEIGYVPLGDTLAFDFDDAAGHAQ